MENYVHCPAPEYNSLGFSYLRCLPRLQSPNSPHLSVLISSHVPDTVLLHCCMSVPTCFWDVALPDSIMVTPSGSVRLSSLETVIAFVHRCELELLQPVNALMSTEVSYVTYEVSLSLDTECPIYSICFTCWHLEVTLILLIVVILMLCFF